MTVAEETTLLAIYDSLPKTERTLRKHLDEYPFTIANDIGHPCEYRIEVNGNTLGMVKYYQGCKLAVYEYVGA